MTQDVSQEIAQLRATARRCWRLWRWRHFGRLVTYDPWGESQLLSARIALRRAVDGDDR